MAFTYSPIASVTVGSGGASTIDFTNIPQNYTDLVIKISGRATGAGADASPNEGGYLYLNNTLSSGIRYLYGNGSSAASLSSGLVELQINDTSSTANTFTNVEIYIPNYTSSVAKSISVDYAIENNATSAFTAMAAFIYSGVTLPIISIKLQPAPDSWAQYSTATLYGIRATEY